MSSDGVRIHLVNNRAMRELRSYRAASVRMTGTFTAGGIPRTPTTGKPAITLRRAEYERNKESPCPAKS